MKIHFKATCPNCKESMGFCVDQDTTIARKHMVTCCIEDGGCDFDFIVEIKLNPNILVFTMHAANNEHPNGE